VITFWNLFWGYPYFPIYSPVLPSGNSVSLWICSVILLVMVSLRMVLIFLCWLRYDWQSFKLWEFRAEGTQRGSYCVDSVYKVLQRQEAVSYLLRHVAKPLWLFCTVPSKFLVQEVQFSYSFFPGFSRIIRNTCHIHNRLLAAYLETLSSQTFSDSEVGLWIKLNTHSLCQSESKVSLKLQIPSGIWPGKT
jgi:hypothetical protein